MLHIAIIYGGPSPEFDVSLRSAATIFKYIDKQKYHVSLIGIDKTGRWYLQQNPLIHNNALTVVAKRDMEITARIGRGLFAHEQQIPIEIDVAFPIIHGVFGEDGALQSILSACQITYVGSHHTASAIGINKLYTKILWKHNGIPVGPYIDMAISPQAIEKNSAEIMAKITSLSTAYRFPLFIKPCNCGSSVGISRVTKIEEIHDAIRLVAQYDSHMLCEVGIDGRELEFAVLGNENVKVSDAGEIITTTAFYDYETKYNTTENAQLIAPATLDSSLKKDIQKMVKVAYRAIGAAGFARVDIFLSDKQQIFFNEINTIPGFTEHSMYPLLWKLAGIDERQLISTLINLAYAGEAVSGKQ